MRGTSGFRGTQVEKHWPRLSMKQVCRRRTNSTCHLKYNNIILIHENFLKLLLLLTLIFEKKNVSAKKMGGMLIKLDRPYNSGVFLGVFLPQM
jgi:hypothetical protein